MDALKETSHRNICSEAEGRAVLRCRNSIPPDFLHFITLLEEGTHGSISFPNLKHVHTVARGLGFSESEQSFCRFLRPGLAGSFIKSLLPQFIEKAEAMFAGVEAQLVQGDSVDFLDSLVAPLAQLIGSDILGLHLPERDEYDFLSEIHCTEQMIEHLAPIRKLKQADASAGKLLDIISDSLRFNSANAPLIDKFKRLAEQDGKSFDELQASIFLLALGSTTPAELVGRFIAILMSNFKTDELQAFISLEVDNRVVQNIIRVFGNTQRLVRYSKIDQCYQAVDIHQINRREESLKEFDVSELLSSTPNLNFGAGSHACPGQWLALQLIPWFWQRTLKLLLLLDNYEIDYQIHYGYSLSYLIRLEAHRV
ncbi:MULTISPECIES: hypothetical protein [Idiomarinaceae]|uniref:Cytochrome P450 n=1 Tax=Pseudidiomarina fusca TaxID=2965078 RepID=A0ABU3KYF9_9GAMM|nr:MULTISPECIES: hypothetical protein [Idiomarinaceae]MDT7526342.1 hypothetical protein [Pseudidiomarina sp. GXY010]MRJ42966.1 hypothetical protein [Idiomarina sp. FeN1]NCU58518.1 hypothetical protein [Idiomarina sp. FenA--70]NCU61215.1 hypothetical protein [Idiomarina sp. FenBw--71]UUN12715.1 hypothetical protein KGF88_08610 [Idiomarina loihiensis]